MDLRTKIVEHLALTNKLGLAVREVEHKDLPVDYVANVYGLEFQILYKKKEIRRCKSNFDGKRQKIKRAVRDIIEKGLTYASVSNCYKVRTNKLWFEVKTARLRGLQNYQYDRHDPHGPRLLTYVQEEILLEYLINWKSASSKTTCTCQLCALEHLLRFVRGLAQHNNIGLSSEFKANKITDVEIQWLINFEMKFSEEIFRSFWPIKNCTKQTDK
ncbi:uncharacterized protein LOC114946232 [Nylanderia fulva]|uniref:uncharacterized protein LOC114946232 n=1 Tax=Nylanderia fulva TaxID=613905 RepID=UPI0010FAE97A|nr:uncharacterized protein LOC114946232 [Nylanderia fulva]